jgi:hypothetical protein
MEALRTRPCENLNASVAEAIIFGGEWALVYANLADCALWWKGAVAIAIDVNLSAVRTCRWSRQRL